MTRLDAAIATARTATVDRAAAERYVRELERWAGRPAPRRRWPWLAGGAASAVVAAAVALLVLGRRAPEPRAIQVGAQVAVVAAPDTAYRVVRADRGATEIAVERGAVTARLWHGARAHRLALTGGGVTAIATGTVFSLEVDAAGPAVHVVEGTVEVHAADGIHLVSAPDSWPAPRQGRPPGARLLLAMAAPADRAAPSPRVADAPASAPPSADAPASAPQSADPDRDPPSDDPDRSGQPAAAPVVAAQPDGSAALRPTDAGAEAASPRRDPPSRPASTSGPSPTGATASPTNASSAKADASVSTASPAIASGATASVSTAGGTGGATAATVKDRWRTARLLRSQGKFADAIAECLAISDAHDPTWSPIALVEATRVALGPLADPERAVLLADRLAREWPREASADEVRSLRCRALTQLGRAAECATSHRATP
jgi:hypothetical protein